MFIFVLLISLLFLYFAFRKNQSENNLSENIHSEEEYEKVYRFKQVIEENRIKQKNLKREKEKYLEEKYNELKKIFSYPENQKYDNFFRSGLFSPEELINQFFNGSKNTIQDDFYILFLKKEKKIFQELLVEKTGADFSKYHFHAYYFYKEIDILKSIESALLDIYCQLNFINLIHPYLDDDDYEDILSINIENVFIPNHMIEFLSENKKIYKQNKDLIFSKFKEYQLPYLYITINDFQIISNNIVNNENVDIELILKKKKNNKKYKINRI